MKKLLIFAAVLSIIFMALPLRAFADAPASSCTLCIVEFQTQGATDATEEYVVVANTTPAAITASLKYFSSAGNLGVNTTVTVSANSVTPFIAPVLKTANPNIAGVWPTGMNSTAGSLQLVTTSGGVMDQVGWGSATKREGTSSAAHAAGYSLMRKQTLPGVFQDTGNNSADFISTPHSCYNLALNEIQPFGVDQDGNDTNPAIEILKSTNANTLVDCGLNINGTNYRVAAGDLAGSSSLATITNVIDSQGNVVPTPLSSSSPNTFQFMPSSTYAAITTNAASLSQPIINIGQTYAKIGSNWQATYAPTLGSSNIYAAVPPVVTVADTVAVDDDCNNIFVNELLPNPSGDDTGHEWLELYNARNSAAYLSSCMVSVNGTNFGFSSDQTIDAGGYLLINQFDGGASMQAVALKNSGTNVVSFGHVSSTGSFTALQTIQYKDAPESQSWARFDDGWRWVSTLTPGQENVLDSEVANMPVPTEFPAANDATNQTSDSLELPIIITELLPNPAAPATDANDEYVELYNASDTNASLNGYQLQTGIKYAYTYSLDGQTIPAGGYLVLYSKDTKLSLSNTTGTARLLDPSGNTISQTDVYNDAPSGQAWALIDGIWQWTGQATPGGTNIATASLPTILTAAGKKSAATKAASKAKAPAVAKVKAAAKKAPAKTTTSSSGANTTKTPTALHPAILAVGGLLALVYAGYEYRTDIANKIYQLKRYRKYRGTLRTEP